MSCNHPPPGQESPPQSPTSSSGLESARLQLQRQWWLAVPLLLLPVLFVGITKGDLLQTDPASAWPMLAGLLLAGYFLFYLYLHLECNRRLQEPELLPTLGAANWLTLGRASAVVVLSGLFPASTDQALQQPAAWAPGLLYLSLSTADLLDGWIARRQRRETLLGQRLDMTVDAAGLLVASLLAVLLGRLPAIYLLVGVAYYLFCGGICQRQRRGLPLLTLQPRPYARIIAGFQMGLVGVALLPLVPAPFSHTAALLFMAPLLAGFLRDWLVVSARLATDQQQRSRLDQWAASLWEVFLPPWLRLILLATAAAELSGWLGLFDGDWRQLAFCALAALAAAGCLTRLATLALTLLLALASNPAGETVPLVVFTLAILLLLTGPGPGALWAPEEAILYRRRPAGDNDVGRGR